MRFWKSLLGVVLAGLSVAALASEIAGSSPAFSEQDLAKIRHHYATVGAGTLVKLAAPAGAEVAPNRRLPGGMEYELLPKALESDLAVLPDPYVRVRIGTDIAILDGDTLVVRDLARNVIEARALARR